MSAPDLVPIPSVLLPRLDALGVDVEAILQAADLDRERLAGPGARVTTKQFMSFWRAIEDVGGSRDLGLRVGAETIPHRYDVASLSAIHSPNLGEALKKMARYKRLVCPEAISVAAANGEVAVRFDWLLAEGRLPIFLVDSTFAAVVAFTKQGTGKDANPKRVELARPRRDEALIAAHFGCDVSFEAPHDRLVFDERWLTVPFVTHDADLLAVLVPGLEAALTREAPSFLTDAKRAIAKRMRGERPTVDKLAADLKLSARTLQRRFEEAGTTYQALLDEVRRVEARQLLTGSALDIGEIAYLLGFEELNSFSRAFHGWEGTSPARYRAMPRS